MKKIVFFTETKWAFGQIHNSLCRRLFSHGINAEVLDFFTQYSATEMRDIDRHTDLFVTTPVGVGWLLNYGISPGKIVSIAHAQWDILLANSQIGTGIYQQLAGYGVVSNILKQKSEEFGVPVVPTVLQMGIEFDRYYQPPSLHLDVIGFAGAFESRNFAGEEIKRGRLVKEIASQTNSEFRTPACHYLAMSGFYGQVDCVFQASTEEGAGLPMMEAAAAGRLCLGTDVGYFSEHHSVGIHLPTSEQGFVNVGAGFVRFFRDNPVLYQQECYNLQDYARENYDWSKHIEGWVSFLS